MDEYLELIIDEKYRVSHSYKEPGDPWLYSYEKPKAVPDGTVRYIRDVLFHSEFRYFGFDKIIYWRPVSLAQRTHQARANWLKKLVGVDEKPAEQK